MACQPEFPRQVTELQIGHCFTGSILDEAGKLLNQHRALFHPCSTDTLTQRGSPSASEINTQQKKPETRYVHDL